MSVDVGRFLGLYIEESLEGLEQTETGLLRLADGESSQETIDLVFRAIHSIKGGSGTFGLESVVRLSHSMEALLEEMRNGHRQPEPSLVDGLLKGTDRLRQLLNAANHHTTPPGIDDLLALFATPAEAAVAAKPAAAAPAPTRWRIAYAPHGEVLATGNDPLFIVRDLASLGELAVCTDDAKLPPLAELDPERIYLSFNCVLAGAGVTRERLLEAFSWVDGQCELVIEPALVAVAAAAPVAAVAAAPAAAAPPAASSSGGAEANSIRVGIEKVDSLVNAVGELVITQSMLNQLAKSIDPAAHAILQKGLDQLERNARELQDTVLRIRMLPLRVAFARLRRLVHDLEHKLGKHVDLQIVGEETELDKTVLEKTIDPLTHLVRNCIDHGIETPAARTAAGKSERGTLRLSAYHQSGSVVIEVSDDGAGLNLEKIERRGRERGLIAPEAKPTAEELHQLIFLPGFSTTEQVSDVSGRGVGMDVVSRNISALNGHVQVTSTPGQGTRFSIRLPLTLAILDGQLVRVGDTIYIFPLISIRESLSIRKNELRHLPGGLELHQVRGEYIPVLWLDRLFPCGEVAQSEADTRRLLVIVQVGEQRIGLVVDDLLEQQQVVIKSLEANFRRVPGVSGATILGDGRVALILDAAGLVQVAEQRDVATRSQRSSA